MAMAGMKMKSSRIHSFGINTTQLQMISIRVEACRLVLQNVYNLGDTMIDISNREVGGKQGEVKTWGMHP